MQHSMTVVARWVIILAALAARPALAFAQADTPPAGPGAHAETPPAAAPDRSPSAFDIAITLDDLPFVNRLGPGDARDRATARILAALARHHVPATGFVVCGRAGRELLAQWIDAGFELGNHSMTHPHLDRLDLETFRREVCDCRDTLTALTGKRPRWFRYPFLQEGRTLGRRDSALAIVRACGQDIGQVSVDTGEWALVTPYADALDAGDRERAARIGQAYVDHLMAAIRHYRAIAAQRAGRDIGYVLLLHANALAADHLDALLTEIEKEGARFVSLADALADPIYQEPDAYAGPIGLSWLYRFAPAVDSLWTWDDEQVVSMQERFPAAQQ